MAAVAVRETAARVPDATGVGAAVVDMLRDAGLRFVSVTITASEEEVGGGGTYRVPKRDLIAAPQVLLQCRRVRIAALPEAETLAAELRNFRYEVTRAGRDTYAAWREGDYDDLVLAVALAVWATQKAHPRAGLSEPQSGCWQRLFATEGAAFPPAEGSHLLAETSL